MQIAFYAPMKSPDAARPSGDRRIARLFIQALEHAGYTVNLASNLRSWEGNGDGSDQQAIREHGEQEARELIAHYRALPLVDRPGAWLTYHLYHKAPDWIGPAVSEALGIPYLVAEASVACKQQDGPWQTGHRQVLQALGSAAAVFSLNPFDLPGVLAHTSDAARHITLAPFLNLDPDPGSNRHAEKQRLGATLKIQPDRYWLLCVAMMRDDSKLASYRILADALDRIERSDWSMLIVGDGVAQTQVRELFRYDNARQVFFLGRRDEESILALMRASDLLVWPGVNEAIGMVALEAMACGLPVVWGRSGGIASIIENNETGILIDETEPAKLAGAIAETIGGLLDDPGRTAAMSSAASAKYASSHTLKIAAAQLRDVIDSLIV